MLELRRTPFEIVGFDRAGQKALVVDLTVRDDSDATDFRRNLLGHIPKPAGAFFLAISRTEGYLWKSMTRPDSVPDVGFAFESFLSQLCPGHS